jgi:hypothetical protein
MTLRFRLHTTRVRVAAWSLVLLSVAAVVHAQSEAPCPEGFPRTADLGIRQLEGNFSIALKRVQEDPLLIRKMWKFSEEPRIGSIDPSGPSYGKLKDGDVLVAIDDALITTSEAGRRLGALDPDDPVKLTVRRDGRTVDVKVRPRSRCPDEQLARIYRAVQDRMATPRPPRPPRAPRTPRAPAAPAPETMPVPSVPEFRVAPPAPMAAVSRKLLTRGWIGVGLDCGECKWVAVQDSVVWRSNEFPTIYNVDEDSPADKAGLRRGDMLTEINGVSLLSDEGAHLFGSVKPGQPVKWTFEREGETKTTLVVASARPGQAGQYAQDLERLQRQLGRLEIKNLDDEELRRQLTEMQRGFDATRRRTPAARQKVRWTGSVGDADVTVQGLANVSVTTDEETGEIVITTGETTVRIKKSDLEKKKGRK